MGRRLLASFLAVAMMLTMAPFAFAIDDANSNAVAKIGDTEYPTLQAAIEAAKKYATITLTADTDENVVLGTYNLTLDLNGHTINGKTEKSKPTITVTARTTIKDTSVAQTGTIKREDTAENSGKGSHYVIDIQGNGWLTFESGKVENNSGNDSGKGASLVRIGDDSVSDSPGLNIKGGIFTQDNFIAVKVDRGDLFLNGGTINSAHSYAIEDWHRTTINAGTVNGDVAAWTYSGGANSSIKLNGGIINGKVYAVNYGNAENRTATVTITGGTVSGDMDTCSYDPQTGELTRITDTTKAAIDVTGGTFTENPTAYLGAGAYISSTEGNKYQVAKSYVAKIGDKGYYTMDEAFHAATAGQTITMQRDYTTDTIQNSGSKSFTIDLNNHTWTCTGKDPDSGAFEINYPDVTLTVKNGKVVSNQLIGLIPSAVGGTITYDNAGLLFENVDMTTSAINGFQTNGNNTNDTIVLKNSTLNVPNGYGIYFPSSGSVTLEDSKINAKTLGVQVCAGSLNVKNSDITVTGDPIAKTENDGAIEDGAAISVVNRTGYKGLGKVTIESGKFTAKSGNQAVKAYKWENKTESDFDNSKNTVAISGGTFSSAITGLTAPGYKTELTNGVYVVKAGTNDAINAIDEALAAVSKDDDVSEDGTKTAVTDAVAAVKDIPNDKLTDTTTMDKLAKLEEAYKTANTGNDAIEVTLTQGDGEQAPAVTPTEAKNAALSASAGETITINVDKADADTQTAVANAIGGGAQVEALDITMKIDGTEAQPKAPVVLTFELPKDKENAQIYRIEGNTATKIPTTLNVNAEGKRTISGTFDHFSTYGIQYLNATANENKYTLILQPNTREVSAGDTLTYTVSLRHDAGSDNDTISGLRFNLDANEGLKLNPSESKGFDNTVTFGQTGGNGNYQFNFVGTKTLQTNQTMSVGTLSYTVQDYGNNGDKVTAPVANTTVVTNSGTNVLPSLSVDSGDVTYHEIELTFVQPAGVSSKYYAKYNATGLYETIADMINGTMAEAPTVTDPNSTEYRLIDTDWHAETDMDTIYDINSTKNIMSTTYVTNKQEIVKVTVPDGVTITSTPVTERSGEKYIDKGVELTFTVKNPDAGMKNKVTATIGNGTSEELTPAANGTYTVPGNKITGDVTITVTQELALTAADIKIFKTDSTNGGVQGYLPYSTYSGTRTLVLIKGAAGVNYTLGKNQPEIFALPEGAYKTDDGSTSYTHAVLMEPTDVVSEEAMLTALKNAGLQTTADNVTLITYDWETAGGDALDFQNVTTTYDFKSLTADKFKWDPSDAQLLKADVLNLAGETNVYQEESYQTARDGHVSDEDVAAFMYLYAKLAK